MGDHHDRDPSLAAGPVFDAVFSGDTIFGSDTILNDGTVLNNDAVTRRCHSVLRRPAFAPPPPRSAVVFCAAAKGPAGAPQPRVRPFAPPVHAPPRARPAHS